jgi:hypothetical protein
VTTGSDPATTDPATHEPASIEPDDDATATPEARPAVGHRRWRNTAAALAALLVLSLAYGIYAGNAATQWQDHAEELEDANGELAAALRTVEGKEAAAVGRAEEAEAANAELAEAAEEREAELDERAAELDDREKDVSGREDAVTATEERIAATRITEGTWTVGTDIEPGTYRTTDAVTGDCYWAIYRSGSNQDSIVQNDIVSGGHPTVTLREDQDFESNRCGTWDQQ